MIRTHRREFHQSQRANISSWKGRIDGCSLSLPERKIVLANRRRFIDVRKMIDTAYNKLTRAVRPV